MPRQRRTTIIVVGGALAIASVGGYGLGTQADGGTAIADSTTTEQDGGTPERHGGPPLGLERGAPPGFTRLADRLGVDADTLAGAMRDFHDQHEADGRDEFAGTLAKALGVSRADLRKAFAEVRAGAEGHFKQERHELARFLAERFNLDVSEVQDALAAVAPPLRSPHPPGLRHHPTPF
jgi:hypothetical protein